MPTRRQLLTAASAFTIVPRHVLGGARFKSPNEKLDIVAVGIGGMGANYIAGCDSENIVGLCDVDHPFAGKVLDKYPSARRWTDYRKMFDQLGSFDAVIIGTPDHSHAVIAAAAMARGKHVYCAKPLTRTLQEARTLARLARETGVATQMSVQSCGSDNSLNTVEAVQAGAVGRVHEVHVWTDRPVWPQYLARPAAQPVPDSLDWDLWLGPARNVPYNSLYHPFNWRGWVDFGTGALGDMACHAFHVVFQALALAQPVAVQADVPFVMEPDAKATTWFKSKKLKFPESYPAASIVAWDFPARGKQPPVRMFWYDGGLRPPRPAGLKPDTKFGPDGLMFTGDRGTLLAGFTGGRHELTGRNAASWNPPPKRLPRVTEPEDKTARGHYQEWVRAAKGGKPAACNFEFGSLLTEAALIGTVAQRTSAHLEWDAAAMRFTNNDAANGLLHDEYRAGWTL
jgi:predicted dehydrogenase